VTDVAGGKDSRDPVPPKQSKNRSRWFSRLYTRRQVSVMILALLIGAVAVWQADRLQAVSSPPPVSTQPVISLLLSPGQQLSWATNAEYQVVETFGRCQNPVTVELDVLVNGTDVNGTDIAADAPTATPYGYAHGELIDPIGTPSKIELLENTQETFPARFVVPPGEFVRHTRGGLLFGAPVRAWYPSAVQPGMSAVTVRAPVMEIRFQADWVLPRSTGTCYVRLPALQVPQIDPAEPPGTAVWAPAAGPGQVSVVSATGDVFDWQTSIPPPTDPADAQWTCATATSTITAESPAANCGGVAVFSAPDAQSHINLWLLIDGAFIGIAAALFVDPVTKLGERRGKSSRKDA
jgi:hypothetical protein